MTALRLRGGVAGRVLFIGNGWARSWSTRSGRRAGPAAHPHPQRRVLHPHRGLDRVPVRRPLGGARPAGISPSRGELHTMWNVGQRQPGRSIPPDALAPPQPARHRLPPLRLIPLTLCNVQPCRTLRPPSTLTRRSRCRPSSSGAACTAWSAWKSLATSHPGHRPGPSLRGPASGADSVSMPRTSRAQVPTAAVQNGLAPDLGLDGQSASHDPTILIGNWQTWRPQRRLRTTQAGRLGRRGA
jgi:hypothetical protein